MEIGAGMRRSIAVTFTLGLILIGLFVSAMVGCGEKDTLIIVDEDEILRYMANKDIARELFRLDGLFMPVTYTVPFDSATYRDSVVGHSRTRYITLVPLKVANSSGDSVVNERAFADYGIYGDRVREAIVWVHDNFDIQVTRTYTDTVVVDTVTERISRGAFFLKLGDDSRDYVGWLLWGFGALSTEPGLGVTLKTSSGTEFRGDWAYYTNSPKTPVGNIRYVRLTEMDTVHPGDRLLVSTYKTTNEIQLPTTQLIFDYSADGLFSQVAYRYDTLEYVDSVSYETPTPNPRLYNLVHIQKISPSDSTRRGGFVVPYRW